MVLEAPRQPLVLHSLPVPNPGPDEVLVRIAACAVCRTDLHVVDGELPDPKLPLIPGHEIVGRIERVGETIKRFQPGERVGIPWLGWTCGQCQYCRSNRENLCDNARFTGYTIMEVTQSSPSLTLPSVFRFQTRSTTSLPLLCSVPD